MALDFAGAAGADVNLGNPQHLRLTGACAMMCWIKFNNPAQNVDLISKQKTGNRGFTLQTDDDPPTNTWGIFFIAVNSSQMKNSGWTATPMLAGNWYHLAGQFIPSTSVQVWLDGALSSEGTASIPATQYNPTNNVTLGGRPDDIGNVNGVMDDVRIYDRNLSAEEMQTIYNARGRDRIVDGLLGRWMMNEKHVGASASGASSIIDLSPYGNHGTPYGANVYDGSILEAVG